MNRRLFLLTITCVLLVQSNSLAQSQDLRKYEVGIEFSSLEREAFGQHQMEAGVGARFTFNFNRMIAFETAGYFYPDKCNFCRNAGNVSQVLAGAKVGKRFEKWGIFGKARPGVVSFSRGEFNPIIISPFVPIEVQTERSNHFALDLGGVLEFYPTDRIVTRFDAGDTLIHFGRRTINGVGFNFDTGQFFPIPITTPARTTHNFQFTAGVGFRF